ncbi:MAG: rhomboid family intramembrane serine protease [Phycisphaerae bacterium]
MKLRIRYNAPVLLTFSLVALAVHVIDATAVPGLTGRWFTLPGWFDWTHAPNYLRLVTYTLGHSDWEHLLGNLPIVLLLGAFVEDKYGSRDILAMTLVTALVAAVLNALLFESGLRGASGVVFMLIVLASLGNVRRGELPLTFVLVAGFFLAGEILASRQPDRTAQWAHMVGGVVGGVFGLLIGPHRGGGGSGE